MIRKFFETPLRFARAVVLITVFLLAWAAGLYVDSYRQHPAPSPVPLPATCVPSPPATCIPAQPVTPTPVPTEVLEVESTLKPILDNFNVSWYITEDTTRSGVEPYYGIVACPNIFPFGTRFIILTRRWANWIVRTEEFVCEDYFADPRYFGLDIWFPSREAANEWPLGTYWVLILFDDLPLEEQEEIVVDRNPFIPKTLDAYYDEERRKWRSPADREEE